MAVNRGKQFEDIFKKSVMDIGVSIDRYPDPMAGYAGIRNICDFGIYEYPHFIYVECKTIHGNTLNFKSGITDDQWQGLLEKANYKGVISGVLIWFIEHDLTAFIHIEELERLSQAGYKSLNIKDVESKAAKTVLMDGEKKRVLFKYETREFLDNLYKAYL